MSYTFNPTPAEANLLAQIPQRESGGNYGAQNPAPGSTASGACSSIQPGSWRPASRTMLPRRMHPPRSEHRKFSAILRESQPVGGNRNRPPHFGASPP
jgi:hypothetical protein